MHSNAQSIMKRLMAVKKTGKLHRINLSGLHPGTEYRYRIFSKEIVCYKNHRVLYGNTASSNVYSQKPYQFRTLDVNADKVSFRVVNDLHSKNENLSKMLGGINRDNTDLVIFNGDMISILNDTEQIFNGFMDTAVALFAKEIPLFFSRGNHETRGGRGSAGLYDYFPTKTGEFYYFFFRPDLFISSSWMAVKTNPILILNIQNYLILMPIVPIRLNGWSLLCHRLNFNRHRIVS